MHSKFKMIHCFKLLRLVTVLTCVITHIGVDSIRLLSISVPHQAGAGQDVQLQCVFALEGHRLYSVKWFKGAKEFFRVVPNEKPQRRVFPVSALDIDMDRSNESVVTIRNIKHANSGRYRCEVSGEAPDFETDFTEANMTVIDLPQQGPIIINVQENYHAGERVELNCTSAPSNPVAVLSWYIDDQLVAERFLHRYVDQTSVATRRWSKERNHVGDHVVVGKATLGVTFSASTERTNVTCVAIVGDIYKSATSATLTVVDLRFRTTTIRPPSHLHAASEGNCVAWFGAPRQCIWLLSTILLHHLI